MKATPTRTAPISGWLATLLSSLALLSACGGGDAVDPTSFTQGTITGFGSVIVNGVRFDDSTAAVLDDSGGKQTSGALRLGMRVEIDGGAINTNAATARAEVVRFGSLVAGPVELVNAGAGTLTVLGQGIDVNSSTVFGDGLSTGLAAVAVGAVLEVHGLSDAKTGRILATRIEAKAGSTSYKLRGPVSALNTTAKTLRIGGATINYAAVTAPVNLANGLDVRAVLATKAVNGVWPATALATKAGATVHADLAHVRGIITAFTSTTSFSVDGIVVDAKVAKFPDGSTGMAVGTQVDVLGKLSNGTLVATQVGLESRHSTDDDRLLQLHGSITAVNPAAKTFVLRDTTVSYDSAVVYTGGTVTGLVVGAKLEVRGKVGSRRNELAATKIKFTP